MWDLPPLAPVSEEQLESTAWWAADASAAAPAAPAGKAVRRPSSTVSSRTAAPTEGGWAAVYPWLATAVRTRMLLGPALQAYLQQRSSRPMTCTTAAVAQPKALSEEGFFQAFWEREGRRPEATLAAATEFLMFEQMRDELADRSLPPPILSRLAMLCLSSEAPPVSSTGWPRWRRRTLRLLLDPCLQEAVRSVRKASPTLHRTSREFADSSMEHAWALLRKRVRAIQKHAAAVGASDALTERPSGIEHVREEPASGAAASKRPRTSPNNRTSKS